MTFDLMTFDFTDLMTSYGRPFHARLRRIRRFARCTDRE